MGNIPAFCPAQGHSSLCISQKTHLVGQPPGGRAAHTTWGGLPSLYWTRSQAVILSDGQESRTQRQRMKIPPFLFPQNYVDTLRLPHTSTLCLPHPALCLESTSQVQVWKVSWQEIREGVESQILLLSQGSPTGVLCQPVSPAKGHNPYLAALSIWLPSQTCNNPSFFYPLWPKDRIPSLLLLSLKCSIHLPLVSLSSFCTL